MLFRLATAALRVLEWKGYMGQYRKIFGGGMAIITKATM
jgi:hypothetical protein